MVSALAEALMVNAALMLSAVQVAIVIFFNIGHSPYVFCGWLTKCCVQLHTYARLVKCKKPAVAGQNLKLNWNLRRDAVKACANLATRVDAFVLINIFNFQ